MARGTCWVGYEQKGMKMKNGRKVPNCVKAGTKKGDMIEKPKKAFMGLAVQAAKKSPMSLIGVGADKILKQSETARSFTSNLGIGGKMLGNYYSDIDDKKTEQKATGQATAKLYVGKFIDVELDGEKYSNASKKDYYKGMI